MSLTMVICRIVLLFMILAAWNSCNASCSWFKKRNSAPLPKIDCGPLVVPLVTVPNSPKCQLKCNIAHDRSLVSRIKHAAARITKLFQKENRLKIHEKHETDFKRSRNNWTPSCPFSRRRSLSCLTTAEETALQLVTQYNLDESCGGDVLTIGNISTVNNSICPECPKMPTCDTNQIYRSIDGSCNNLINTDWGMTGTPYRRLLPAFYKNGIYEPRVAKSGNALPSARVVRTAVFPNKDVPSNINTLLAMQFGQFLSHDLALSVGEKNSDGSDIECCTADGQPLPQDQQHRACYPIIIPPDDEFFGQHGITCQDMVRTRLTFNHKCTLSAAEQISSVNHIMDCSVVYGNTDELLVQLRSFNGGQMKTTVVDGNRPFMPTVDNATSVCGEPTQEYCFLAGDVRVNQNPQLTSLHVLLLREHNRIASQLQILNPNWDDETLFQESRRILIAIWQHIVYNEYVPTILGEELTQQLNLTTTNVGYKNCYDETLDPSTLNSFTAAAFRSYHGTIQGNINLPTSGECPLRNFNLSDMYFQSTIVTKSGCFDNMIKGLAIQTAQENDVYMNEEVTDLLFKGSNQIGRDLVSFDIQRNRDHGLAPYNDFREICGLRRANTFEDFSDTITPERIDAIRAVYEHPDDVDLWTGAQSETLKPGSWCGPVFCCILGEQFYRHQCGDRFFYTRQQQPYPFTEAQLAELKHASFSRLYCDNADNKVDEIQLNSFHIPSSSNPVTPCSEIPSVNLNLWKV